MAVSDEGKKFSIKNIKINKKLIATFLAGVISASGIGFTINKIHDIKEKHESNATRLEALDENVEGYDDINPIYNYNVHERNFVLLDAGNHSTIRSSFQERKMRMCNDEDISLGIIITSDAQDECDIYNDVEYVKGLIRDYDIDLPVYLNIDDIINNNNLNNDMKIKIIKDFLEKCSANGIYVGVNGTDTNLCRIKEYCNIDDYDAYLVKDSEEIKYNGKYSIHMDLDGNLHSDGSLKEIIKSKGFNTTDKFKNDIEVDVNSHEEIVDIALRYGMSVNDLLRYNGISTIMFNKKLDEGCTIKIPCVIANEKENEEKKDLADGEYLVGCDISYCQGDNVDWDVVSENFDYVIVKCNQGVEIVDNWFETYARECNINNIPMGVYTYNNYWATSLNYEDFCECQEKQADYTVSLLNNKSVEYPVYLDVELEGGVHEGNMPIDFANAMIDTWVKKMTDAGYIPGIYCNQSTFNYLQSCVDYPISDKMEVWIAGGPQYATGVDYTLDEVQPAADIFEDQIFNANMNQATSTCINAGAYDASGYLDIDFSKVNYAELNKEPEVVSDNQEYEIKDFVRADYKLITALAAAVGIAGCTVIVSRKLKKNKTKIK